MPQVVVTINERKYRMACEDGQEDHLRQLAQDFDRRITDLRAKMGEIGDMRLTVVAALTLADELFETRVRLQDLKAELAGSQERGTAAADRAQATQAAVVAALDAASARIEHVTKSLNQSLADSVPMG